MKKIIKVILLTMLIGGLGACSSKKNPNNSSSTETSTTTKSTESSSKEKEVSKVELFDKLPDEVKAVLYADVVDKRVRDYPGLEDLELGYCSKDNDVFVQITSGVGTGHPVYQIELLPDGIKPIKGSAYMGVSGVEAVPVDTKEISKETLYDNYLEHKDDFEKASKKAKVDEYLKNTTEDSQQTVESSSKEETVVNVSDAEKLQYFKDYILADLNVSGLDFIKQHTDYGVDEKGDQMIRYGGGMGAYAYTEGSKIIYEVYSFGGVRDDGTAAKNFLNKAYYDTKTGEHGLIN